jgi:peroxiredoxin (alkyl hydroperoxide reductase subunit C)
MDNHQPITAMPRIGDEAPSFKAVTTQGEIDFPAQYSGSWVILFSHPADFTPVCTSEFITFASMEDTFAEANCKLVGLSVDGLYSHIAWLRTIKEKIEYRGMKDVEVNFPLIEDITMEVAKKYGMIQPGEDTTKAVRAVFYIDPQGIIRTIFYYPPSLGRNLDEIYRALIALHASDAFNVATPADRRPGDDVIVSPAGSCGVAKDRMDGKEERECQGWFFRTKKTDKDKILSTFLKKSAERLLSGMGSGHIPEGPSASPPRNFGDVFRVGPQGKRLCCKSVFHGIECTCGGSNSFP